ncbi:MAG: cyclic nucleotide-binding domain-containing protein, partial [Lentisphaeraceae bacterium]|nr:cyclic nucleotide-binding domain-containing protein [Lentisphaeraceae bacterium]
GNVNVHVVRDDNKDHDVAVLGRGEYFGEIALFKNIPRTATVTADTDEVLVISLQKNDFMKAIDSQSALETNLENVTHRRIIEMMH